MERLKYGMPTLIELDTLEDNAKLCSRLGLDFVEINMNVPDFQVSRLDSSKLINLMDRYGIFFTFHLEDDMDIAHFNHRIRMACWESVFDTIELMKIINSPIINIHMSEGVRFTLPQKRVYLFEKFDDEYTEAVEGFSNELQNRLDDTNINLVVENTGIYNKEYVTNAVDKMIEQDNIGLTWDIGHDHIGGEVDRDYIIGNVDKLKHMHFHDAQGKRDHLVIGDGVLNTDYYLGVADRFDLSVVLETKTIKGLEKTVYILKTQKGPL